MLGLQQGDLDIYDGSPPCAGFSTSGKRSDGWNVPKAYSDTIQRVDDLFFEYIRLLRGLMPKVFVAENVSGLVKGVAKGYFLEILEQMKDSGYRVAAKKLDARWLGVPQQRERLIFIGVRSDLGLDPVFPRPMSQQYTVKDVLPHIAYVKHSGHAYNYKPSWEAPSPTIMQSEYGRCESAYLSGGGWVKTDSGDTRQWTLEELRLLCSFPADFRLLGTPAQQWERLGRAVPPLMMCRIAGAIYDGIFKRLDEGCNVAHIVSTDNQR
jgi:DNA (cytosine-5)-methyltransferase 1